jgi:hypothetical protein
MLRLIFSEKSLDTFTSNNGIIQFAKYWCTVSNVDGFGADFLVVISAFSRHREKGLSICKKRMFDGR